MKEIAAILLAAGRSSRMGSFKPLLPFGNSSVIRSCLSNLRAAGIAEIVIVVGHRGDEVRDQLMDLNPRFAVNPVPDSAMSVSIAYGVEQVSSSMKALLVALVDHPAVPSEVIEAIVAEWERGSSLVQPEYEGRGGHPVLVDLRYRAELMHLDPSQGLRSLFERHRPEVARLPVDSPYVARDMDTWEDYLQLHQEVFGRTPEVDLGRLS